MKRIYLILIPCLVFLAGCSGPEIHKNVMKIDNYSHQHGNAIVLGIKPGENSLFTGKIDVKINHGKSNAGWRNLVFGISTKDDLYYATSENHRFIHEEIFRKTPNPVTFEIDLDELDYSDPSGKRLSRQHVFTKLQTSQKINIWATIENPGRSKNEYTSTLLEHSGPVEISFK